MWNLFVNIISRVHNVFTKISSLYFRVFSSRNLSNLTCRTTQQVEKIFFYRLIYKNGSSFNPLQRNDIKIYHINHRVISIRTQWYEVNIPLQLALSLLQTYMALIITLYDSPETQCRIINYRHLSLSIDNYSHSPRAIIQYTFSVNK